jgi:hypothetical protein
MQLEKTQVAFLHFAAPTINGFESSQASILIVGAAF